MLAYLAGAIEYAPDHGKGWRREVTPILRGFGYDVYDPAEDERKSLTEEEQLNLRAWKTTDLARFLTAVRKIIRFDLDIIARADLIVCYFDEYCLKGGGTPGEITFAHRNGIPVFIVTPMPVTEISGWILGCSAVIFDNFTGLKEYIQSHMNADLPRSSRNHKAVNR
jgi:hypothetical protein